MIPLATEQGTPDWHVFRGRGIGGSDVAAIMGLSPWKSRAELLQEKVTGKRDTISNFAMARGTRLEPIARALYEARAGCRAVPVCVQHDTIPWARASLDGLCSRDGTRWLCEIKCPAWDQHARTLAGDEVPTYYRCQMQWQLFVCCLDRNDYVSYSDNSEFSEGERIVVVPVPADLEYQAELLRECTRFWEAVLEGRREYEATGVYAGERTVGQILADEERELERQLVEMGLAPVGQLGRRDNAAVLSEIEAGMKLAAEPGWWS